MREETVVFWSNGDPSANISGQQVEMRFQLVDEIGEEAKKSLLDGIAETLGDVFDDKFYYADQSVVNED